MAVSAKDYQKAYYILNREKRLQYQKEYNKNNIEAYKDYQRAYFLIHKEDITNKNKVQRKIDKILYPPIPKKRKVKRIIPPVVETPEPEIPVETSEPEKKKDYNKYYYKKVLQREQYALKEPEPFADFYRTSQGFALDW